MGRLNARRDVALFLQGLGVLCVCVALSPSARAQRGCAPPPYDPLVAVATPEAALSMDGWAIRALRRDRKGKTCPAQQEVVDVLLVRWLQAHPDIRVAFNGTETDWMLRTEGAFLLRIKAEAWAAHVGRRAWFPRSWGRHPEDAALDRRRRQFVAETGERWGRKS